MRKLLVALLSVFVATSAQAAESAAAPATAQADAENTIIMQLKDGTVEIRLLPEKAPKTVARIKELARKGFYDGIVFHRVIEGFMAQGGDPTGTGGGGSGVKLPDEFPTAGYYSRGDVAMANAGPGTSDSQFFIMFADRPLPPAYTIFGRVVKGMDVVDKIKRGDSFNNGSVTNPDKIISMKVAADVNGKK